MLYIIPIAWLYIVVLMSVAEATSPQGTLLGAIVTFILYGLLPLSIVMYIAGSPLRRKAAKRRQEDLAAAPEASPSDDSPDGSSQSATDTIPPVREKT